MSESKGQSSKLPDESTRINKNDRINEKKNEENGRQRMEWESASYAKPTKPISMWQAPQSLLHPTAPPLKQVSEKRKETYFRRVAMPERYEGPPPAKWQRKMQIAGGIFSGICGLYIIFLHDYGPKEHVFSPIRRMIGINNSNFFRLSPEEKDWVIKKQTLTKPLSNGEKGENAKLV